MQISAHEKADTLDFVHCMRIISNVLSLGIIRTSEYILHYRIENQNLVDNIKEIEIFIFELDQMNNDLIRNKF